MTIEKWEDLPESIHYGVDRCDKCGRQAEANGLCSIHLKAYLKYMNSMINKKFRNNLRRMRLDAGLTQEELAITCDLPFTVVCHYERGHRVPNLINLKKLWVGLDTDPNELLL